MAALIDVLAAGVVDTSGTVLASGKVYFYEAGTTTLLTVYQDAAGTIPHANPATLDASGRLVAYATVNCKLVIEESDGSSVITIDDVQTGPSTDDVGLSEDNESSFSGTDLSEILESASTSLGYDFLYKYKTVGETRTYLSRGADRVSVKDFGAVGDGIVDDTDAINDAISNLTSGECLYFPQGTYKCTDDIDVAVANITLMGAGKASKITLPAGKEIGITASGVRVMDLWIDGTSAAAYDDNGRLISISGSSAAAYVTNCVVDRCILTNSSGYGIFTRWASDCIFTNNHIEDFVYCGINVNSQLRTIIANNVIKDGNAASGPSQCYGITASRFSNTEAADPRSSRIVMANNVVEEMNNGGRGIDVHGATDCSITGNVTKDCDVGINIVSDDNTELAPKRISVVGNTLYGNGSVDVGMYVTGVGSGVGSTTDEALSITVSGNQFYNHGVDSSENGAMRCQHTRGLVIQGNAFHEPIRYAIVMNHSNYGFLISNNICTDVYSASATTGAFVRFAVNYQEGFVEGNSLIRGSKSATSVNYRFISRSNGDTSTDRIIIGYNYTEGTTVHYGTIPSGSPFTSNNFFPARYSGTAAPTSANFTFLKGDLFFQSDPDQNETLLWVCTSAGAPGTWKQIGVVRNETIGSGTPNDGATSGSANDIKWNSAPAIGSNTSWQYASNNNWLPSHCTAVVDNTSGASSNITIGYCENASIDTTDAVAVFLEIMIAGSNTNGGEIFTALATFSSAGGLVSGILSVDDNGTAVTNDPVVSWDASGTGYNLVVSSANTFRNSMIVRALVTDRNKDIWQWRM